jgi:pyruvate/2-oxoglutarate dehydrogenase complex dihydrolipoamide acyltransferase (E2) component
VSNIFGEPLETHSPPKAKEDTAKNIFGVGVNEEEQAKEATSAQEKKKDEKEEAANNNQNTPSATQSAQAYARRMRGTYNPITGEGYDDTQAAAGTRVRQPPGGYSSKLW